MIKRRRSKLERLGDVLSQICKRRGLPLTLPDTELTKTWNEAVGPLIAANTHPNVRRNDTLFVHVTSSMWLHQLMFMKQEIIDKVNSHFTGLIIRDIHFAIGKKPKDSKGASSPLSTAGKMKQRDRELIERSLDGLSDDELKDILRRVMTLEILNRRLKQEGQGS